MKIFKKNNKKINIYNLNYLAINLISILKKLHENKIIHGNLNLKKILMIKNQNIVKFSLIGFKYSILKKLINKTNNLYNKNKLNVFSSLNSHLGLELAKKNDLESLGYILIFLINSGKLFKLNNTDSQNKKIKLLENAKKNFIVENLENNIPYSLVLYMNYIKNLNIEDEINYDYLIKLFKDESTLINFLEKKNQVKKDKLNDNDIFKKTNRNSLISSFNEYLNKSLTNNENNFDNYKDIFNEKKINKINNLFQLDNKEYKIISKKVIKIKTDEDENIEENINHFNLNKLNIIK